MIKTFKFRKLVPLVLIAFAAPVAFSQQASDEISVTAGVRMWYAQWNANSFPAFGSKQVAVHLDSNSKLVPIITAAVRYKDFGLSASHFSNTNFEMSDGLIPFTNSRSETDLNILYYFLPSLSASLGYKEAKWFGVKNSGPTVALSASAALASGVGMYGTIGVGKLTLKTDGWLSQNLDADYSLGEVGLSYSFGGPIDIFKGMTVTGGYRFQKIKLKDFPMTNNVRDVNDITSGMTLGLIARF